jgi:hypothetical protein
MARFRIDGLQVRSGRARRLGAIEIVGFSVSAAVAAVEPFADVVVARLPADAVIVGLNADVVAAALGAHCYAVSTKQSSSTRMKIGRKLLGAR